MASIKHLPTRINNLLSASLTASAAGRTASSLRYVRVAWAVVDQLPSYQRLSVVGDIIVTHLAI